MLIDIPNRLNLGSMPTKMIHSKPFELYELEICSLLWYDKLVYHRTNVFKHLSNESEQILRPSGC